MPATAPMVEFIRTYGAQRIITGNYCGCSVFAHRNYQNSQTRSGFARNSRKDSLSQLLGSAVKYFSSLAQISRHSRRLAKRMKVALVHDYLKEYGGGERVLEVLHRIYPDAPVYTAFVNYAGLGSAASRFANWDIRTTFAQNLPGINRRPHTWRFMIPYIWENLDLSEFDVVICSTSGYLSKSILTRPEALHIAYCHTPPWYLWEQPGQKTPRSQLRRWYEVIVNSLLLANLTQFFCLHGQTAVRAFAIGEEHNFDCYSPIAFESDRPTTA